MKAVFILASRGYQDLEYAIPKKILEEAGIEVITASKSGGACVGKLGGMVKESFPLADIKVEQYVAVVFIGGPGAVMYQQDREAHHLAQEAILNQKVLGAICIAPAILAYSGVLKGRKATVWNGDECQEQILKEQGAEYTGEKVTLDGKIVTANGPEAAEEFGKALLKLMK